MISEGYRRQYQQCQEDGSAARWFADPILRNHRDVGAV